MMTATICNCTEHLRIMYNARHLIMPLPAIGLYPFPKTLVVI